MSAPVITVDGPSGVGKGTISKDLADALGWHYLDSGALYRVLGFAAVQAGIDLSDAEALVELSRELQIDFDTGARLDGKLVEDQIRSEQAGEHASQVARHAPVRAAMLDLQRNFSRPPGLVADGRDMGTTIFPGADYKFYLIADAEVRAKRRYKQLLEKGQNGNIGALFQEIRQRDERDMNRKDSPLRPADDAIIIDTTELSIEAVLKKVKDQLPFAVTDKPESSGTS